MTQVVGEEKELLKKLEMDIVFVMDMTASMQPLINATLDAIKNIALLITQDAAIGQSVHFGLWGYRDSLDNAGIEYLTKNFTPTLQPVEAFAPILQGVREATVGSGNFDEDVFSGVNDAMTKTAWTPNAMRFIVLVGDAPSHELGDRWNYSGQSAETLRQFANDHSVYIFALHAKEPEPRLERLHVLAEKQFRTLTTNKGTLTSGILQRERPGREWLCPGRTRDCWRLVQIIAEAKKGQVATVGVAHHARVSPALTWSRNWPAAWGMRRWSSG